MSVDETVSGMSSLMHSWAAFFSMTIVCESFSTILIPASRIHSESATALLLFRRQCSNKRHRPSGLNFVLVAQHQIVYVNSGSYLFIMTLSMVCRPLRALVRVGQLPSSELPLAFSAWLLCLASQLGFEAWLPSLASQIDFPCPILVSSLCGLVPSLIP